MKYLWSMLFVDVLIFVCIIHTWSLCEAQNELGKGFPEKTVVPQVIKVPQMFQSNDSAGTTFDVDIPAAREAIVNAVAKLSLDEIVSRGPAYQNMVRELAAKGIYVKVGQ